MKPHPWVRTVESPHPDLPLPWARRQVIFQETQSFGVHGVLAQEAERTRQGQRAACCMRLLVSVAAVQAIGMGGVFGSATPLAALRSATRGNDGYGCGMMQRCMIWIGPIGIGLLREKITLLEEFNGIHMPSCIIKW